MNVSLFLGCFLVVSWFYVSSQMTVVVGVPSCGQYKDEILARSFHFIPAGGRGLLQYVLRLYLKHFALY
jgi:hypothetical protein